MANVDNERALELFGASFQNLVSAGLEGQDAAARRSAATVAMFLDIYAEPADALAEAVLEMGRQQRQAQASTPSLASA